MPSKNLTIIIPAAGEGRRTRSHGPKSLMKISEYDTIISRQLKIIQCKFPESKIVIVGGFKYNKLLFDIKRYNSFYNLSENDVVCIENKNFCDGNVAQSIRLAINGNNDFLILYGDLVFNKNYLDDFDTTKSSVIVDSNYSFENREVGVVCSDGIVTNFSYGVKTKWLHSCFLKNKDAMMFKSLQLKKPQTYFGFEILNLMLDNNVQITYNYNKSWIVEVDTIKDLEKAREIIKNENIIDEKRADKIEKLF